MARRRYSAKQARYFGGSRRRRSSGGRVHHRRRSSGGSGLMSMILPAAVYGVARAPVATMVSGLSSKLPFGVYNDEVAMAAVSYAVKKYAPGGFIKNVGMAGLIVEAASATSGISSGMLGGNTSTQSDLFSGGY